MRGRFTAFMVILSIFSLGSLVGAATVIHILPLRSVILATFEVRMLAPLRAISGGGKGVLAGVIFLNNSISPLLSFLYPALIGKVSWTPPLSKNRRAAFLNSFALLVAFLLGFFGLGAGLAVSWLIGGLKDVIFLLGSSWLHGPLEFFFILACATEPMKLAQAANVSELIKTLKKDTTLLLICLIGLFVASLIEVFAGI